MRSTADRCAFVAAMLFNLLLWPVGAVPAVAATGAQSYPVKPLRLVVFRGCLTAGLRQFAIVWVKMIHPKGSRAGPVPT